MANLYKVIYVDNGPGPARAALRKAWGVFFFLGKKKKKKNFLWGVGRRAA